MFYHPHAFYDPSKENEVIQVDRRTGIRTEDAPGICHAHLHGRQMLRCRMHMILHSLLVALGYMHKPVGMNSE